MIFHAPDRAPDSRLDACVVTLAFSLPAGAQSRYGSATALVSLELGALDGLAADARAFFR